MHCHSQQEQCDNEHLLSQTQNNRVVSRPVHSRAKMPLYIARREMPSWLRLTPRPTAPIQANLGGSCACAGKCAKCEGQLKAQIGGAGAGPSGTPRTPARRRRRQPPPATPTCTYQVSYANERHNICPIGSCGTAIRYDIVAVIATGSGCPASLNGVSVTEIVTNNHGCLSTNVRPGAGCVITPTGNVVRADGSPCTDLYAICEDQSRIAVPGCTEVITQQILVGGVVAETHTITFTFNRTPGGTCWASVVRSR